MDDADLLKDLNNLVEAAEKFQKQIEQANEDGVILSITALTVGKNLMERLEFARGRINKALNIQLGNSNISPAQWKELEQDIIKFDNALKEQRAATELNAKRGP